MLQDLGISLTWTCGPFGPVLDVLPWILGKAQQDALASIDQEFFR